MLKILYSINLIKRFSTVNTSIGYDQFSGSTRECNHLVTPSPWPLCTSQSAFGLVLAMASFFHGYENSVTCFFFALTLTLTLGFMGFWWRYVVRESTFEGNRASKVQFTVIELASINFIQFEKFLYLIFIFLFAILIAYLILYIFTKNEKLNFLQLIFKLIVNLVLVLAEVPFVVAFVILYGIYILNNYLKKNMISIILTNSTSTLDNFSFFNKHVLLFVNNFNDLIKDTSFFRIYWYYILVVSLVVNPSYAFYLAIKLNKFKNVVELFYSYMSFRKTNKLHYALLPFILLRWSLNNQNKFFGKNLLIWIVNTILIKNKNV